MSQDYKLFLDDVRDAPEGWILCRTVGQAKQQIRDWGLPSTLSFDHDLGYNPVSGNNETSMELMHWIIGKDQKNVFDVSNMKIKIHSANPVGRKNLMGLWDSYMKFKKEFDDENMSRR